MPFLPLLVFSLAGAWPGPISGDVQVQVVDEKQQPVAGAWVAGFEASGAGFDFFERNAQPIDAIQQWIESGATGRPGDAPEWTASNADGRVRVLANSFWSDLVAVTPTLSGHAIFVRGTVAKDDAVEIVVRPHRYWRVPVVDGADRKLRPPAAVEFGIEGDLHERNSFTRLASRATAGAENVATLGPIDLLFDPLEIDPTLVARLDLPIDPAPRLRWRKSQMEAGAPPPPPLTIPPHGSLEVDVVDGEGKLVTRPGFVELRRDPNDGLLSKSGRIWSKSWLNSDLGKWRIATHDGVARFDVVGLGAALSLGPFSPLAPLTQAGERRVITLADSEPATRTVAVRGRLLDTPAATAPRRRNSLELIVPDPGQSGRDQPWIIGGGLSFAPDGRFETTLAVPTSLRGHAWLVVTDVGPLGDDSSAPIAMKCVGVANVGEWNGAELGDVKLVTLPLLASGRAVDEEGEPIEALDVYLECDRDELQHDPAVPEWWSGTDARPATKTAHDGHFELRGFGGREAWQLRAWNVEFPSDQAIPIEIGQADLVVRRPRGCDSDSGRSVGSLAGSLLLDPEVPQGVVDVSIDAPTPSPNGTTTLNRYCYSPPGDRFCLPSIPVGSWNVTVSLRDFVEAPTLFATIPVTIERGKTTTLAPIDLRGRIKVKRLAIQDRAGAPVLGGFMFARREPSTKRQHEETSAFFHDGDAVVCATGEWSDVDFVAEGFRRVRHHFDRSNAETIVLPPALLVHVILPEELRLPPAPLTLDVRMSSDDSSLQVNCDGASTPPQGDSASFETTHAVDLRLPAATKYSLTVSITRHTFAQSPGRFDSIDIQRGREFTFADGDDPIVLDLDVPQAAIDDAVNRLGY